MNPASEQPLHPLVVAFGGDDAWIAKLGGMDRTGWPRPWFRSIVRATERLMPLPWINALEPLSGQGWKAMRPERVDLALKRRLCAVCGERVKGPIVLLRHAHTQALVDHAAKMGVPEMTVAVTDGPGTHPRCGLLAALHCPHLVEQHDGDDDFEIAYVWEGRGHGTHPMPQLGENSEGQSTRTMLVHPHARPLTLRALRAMGKVAT